MPYRIGIGHDIHKLVEERDLWLGGVKIPFEKGLLGHSDADALIHAIMDAMLGALALGDIGEHFPDNDLSYKNIRSTELLKIVNRIIDDKGYSISNIDCVIHCERPKILPYKDSIREILSEILMLHKNRISVKAGTNEGMDSVGAGYAISCDAVVLLCKK
ncbi:MAG: 2-C-methyl-D-erythritol 2,4-cyclodiphosphate synthase [Candidatus Riflebacteria bacterium]|nr:2-C-methyl-D-erythritol 2,4-cyclodiphosphate synthase [Candidatus Riflebacteria bacterium]